MTTDANSDAAPSAAAPVEARGLTKRFGPLTAVDRLSFAVPCGAITGFLGLNGAGKTTTLRMLLGLITPSEGTALIKGRRYSDLPDPLQAVGAVLEASSAHPGRTARNHLRIHALAGGAPAWGSGPPGAITARTAPSSRSAPAPSPPTRQARSWARRCWPRSGSAWGRWSAPSSPASSACSCGR
jgi:energy-coupling factor transporter ATP-binding protein EcfA2